MSGERTLVALEKGGVRNGTSAIERSFGVMLDSGRVRRLQLEDSRRRPAGSEGGISKHEGSGCYAASALRHAVGESRRPRLNRV